MKEQYTPSSEELNEAEKMSSETEVNNAQEVLERKKQLGEINNNLQGALEGLLHEPPLLIGNAIYFLGECELPEARKIAVNLFEIELSRLVAEIRNVNNPLGLSNSAHEIGYVASEYVYRLIEKMPELLTAETHRISQEVVLLLAAYKEQAGTFDQAAELYEAIGRKDEAMVAIEKQEKKTHEDALTIRLENAPIFIAAIEKFKESTKEYNALTEDESKAIIEKSKNDVAALLERLK